jgi:hypothetical protein
LSDDSGGYVIEDSVLYSGSPYNYPIPSYIPPGSYMIKIKQNAICDYSNVFTIQ